MTTAEFVRLPFKTQIHKACLTWCYMNDESAFVNGKPSVAYFRCRAYLWKLPTQTIKNIWIFLQDTHKKSDIYSLEKLSKEYVEKLNTESAKEKTAKIKRRDYDMDSALADFMEGAWT